jgi:hypothetical protein
VDDLQEKSGQLEHTLRLDCSPFSDIIARTAMSFTGMPASACFKIETICVSLNRDFFIGTSWLKHARKLYF